MSSLPSNSTEAQSLLDRMDYHKPDFGCGLSSEAVVGNDFEYEVEMEYSGMDMTGKNLLSADMCTLLIKTKIPDIIKNSDMNNLFAGKCDAPQIDSMVREFRRLFPGDRELSCEEFQKVAKYLSTMSYLQNYSKDAGSAAGGGHSDLASLGSFKLSLGADKGPTKPSSFKFGQDPLAINDKILKKNDNASDNILHKNDSVLNANDSILSKNDSLLNANDNILAKNDSLLNANDDILAKNDNLLNANDDILNKPDPSKEKPVSPVNFMRKNDIIGTIKEGSHKMEGEEGGQDPAPGQEQAPVGKQMSAESDAMGEVAVSRMESKSSSLCRGELAEEYSVSMLAAGIVRASSADFDPDVSAEVAGGEGGADVAGDKRDSGAVGGQLDGGSSSATTQGPGVSQENLDATFATTLNQEPSTQLSEDSPPVYFGTDLHVVAGETGSSIPQRGQDKAASTTGQLRSSDSKDGNISMSQTLPSKTQSRSIASVKSGGITQSMQTSSKRREFTTSQRRDSSSKDRLASKDSFNLVERSVASINNVNYGRRDSSKDIHEKPFRTGPQPDKDKVKPEIHYPPVKTKKDNTPHASTTATGLKKTKKSPPPKKYFIDKRECWEAFHFLEEDVKNIRDINSCISELPEWLHQTLKSQEFDRNIHQKFGQIDVQKDGILPVWQLREIIKSLRAQAPPAARKKIDVKGVLKHFKTIFPPHKNLGFETFLEVTKWLVTRVWIVEQLGGESPAKREGPSKSSQREDAPALAPPATGTMFHDGVKFPQWSEGESELVTQLKNEISWMHAQLSEQRKAEYREWQPNGFSTTGLSMGTSQRSSEGYQTGFSHMADKKPSDFYNVSLNNYSKDDLLMEVRHLKLDLDFFRNKANAVERKNLIAENLAQRTQIRDLYERTGFLENQLRHKELDKKLGYDSRDHAQTLSPFMSTDEQPNYSYADGGGGGGPLAAVHKVGSKRQSKKPMSTQMVLKMAQEATLKEKRRRKFADRRLQEEKDTTAALRHQVHLLQLEIRKMSARMAQRLQ